MPTNQVRSITHDSLPRAAAERFAYSFGVQAGRQLWISGQVALRAGEVVGVGDAAAQARQVFENLSTVLESAGGSLDDLVETTTYLTSRDDMLAVNDVRKEFLTGPVLPTSTLLVVAGLARAEFLVEVSAVAVLADPSEDQGRSDRQA